MSDSTTVLQFNLTKQLVGCRSAIHGRGLFCKRNIEAGEMVIEYAGIVIRSVLTDKREKYYDSKVSQVSDSLIDWILKDLLVV